jgi:hypothetical protein
MPKETLSKRAFRLGINGLILRLLMYLVRRRTARKAAGISREGADAKRLA